MYGLRKIHKDGIHYNFQWPLEVGAVVKCPDWNPAPECGGGLHVLPEAIGDYDLLDGHYWCVVEFDENQMVRIGHDKAKVPECKIVYLSKKRNKLKDFFDFDKFNSLSAYGWACYIGGKKAMINKITDSEYAYLWACHIGHKKIMRDRITNSEYAYWWARNIGDKEIMRDRITDGKWAYWWAREIGDIEIMRDKITDPFLLRQYLYINRF